MALLVPVALLSFAASGAEATPDEEKLDRAFHLSGGPGTLASPRRLPDRASIEKLCEPFGPGRFDDENAYTRGVKQKARREAKRQALREVYQIDLGGKGFKLDAYDVDEGVLPISLEKMMVGLDGDLTIAALDGQGAELELDAKQAEQVAKLHEDKALGLRVVFTFSDDRRGLDGACVSRPKSDAYSLQIYPLSFAVLDPDGKELARSTTERDERFREWLEPGAARVRTEVTRLDGTLDPSLLEQALVAKRSEIERCLEPLTRSPSDTGLASLRLTVLPSGGISDVKSELDSIEDETIIPCLEKAIGAISLKKASKPSRFQILLAVDRAPALNPG